MATHKPFDLNRVPGSCSSFEGSNNEKGDEEPCHEEEEVTKFRRTDKRKPEKKDPPSIPSVSLGIIKDITSRLKRPISQQINLPSDVNACTMVAARKVSTIEIVQLARQRFIQPSSKKVDELECLSLTDVIIRDLELVHILLCAANKVGRQQFDRAQILIKQCVVLSSKYGTSVQRLVHYFADALQEFIKKEVGGSTSTHDHSGTWKMTNMNEALLSPNSNMVAYCLKDPFAQVIHLTGSQMIAEQVREARKVHIICSEIHLGTIYVVLLQDLATNADQPLEHLKITAICTGSKSRLENTGKQLHSFAQSLNLSLTFKAVIVKDFRELKIDLFELDNEEEVIFNLPFTLCKLNTQCVGLDSFIRLIRKINPCLTIITEFEANHTSPIFINRFMESLNHFSAVFDRMVDCMADDELSRVTIEAITYEMWIRNILAPEGVEGAIRHQCINKWRELFAGFGMVETEISNASQDLANMMLKTPEHGSSCTLDMDGNCLVVGWKGVPIFTISAWKFQ